MKKKGVQNFCGFWPEEWNVDLSKVGINYFGNQYPLYSLVNSKIHQLDIISRHGNDYIKENINLRYKILNTEFHLSDPSLFRKIKDKFGLFVVSAPTSAGGNGTFLIKSHQNFSDALYKINSPVVRIEQFVNSISLTQSGVVFSDFTVVYPLQIQYIRMSGMKLSYSGSTSDITSIKEKYIIDRSNMITKSVGDLLAKLGYRGAFGCDMIYLPSSGEVVLMELNPRFVAETFLFSEFAAASNTQDENQKIFLDPLFLHVCSYVYEYCPNDIYNIVNDNIAPIPNKTKEGYSTFLSLNTSKKHNNKLEKNKTNKIALFKNDISTSLIVPTCFQYSIEELSTKLQAD